VALALPAGEVAVLAAFPRIIESKGGCLFTCPASLTLEAVDQSTGKTVARGAGKLEIPEAVLDRSRLTVRALKEGYLVQDLVEVVRSK
jgi:hypothetical protein